MEFKFQPRLYQETIFHTSTQKNTLVVLPTGMGKTNIFLMLAAHRLKLYPKSKILFLGPTKPLIDQYKSVFLSNFDVPDDFVAVFTGFVKPEKRKELWKNAKVIFSTPQGLENDIIAGRINLEEVSLLGIDEAHRAVGDYAYVYVSQQYYKKAAHPRILALTASPGDDIEKVTDICKSLSIEDIEVRSDEDEDVKPYIQEIRVEWEKVDFPDEFKKAQKNLQDFIRERTKKLKDWGVLHRKNLDFVSKTDLLNLQAQLRGKALSGEKDFVIWNAISVLAEIMKVGHALELLETQGVYSTYTYLEGLNKEGFNPKTRAIKNIVKDLNFRTALLRLQRLMEEDVQHPKMIRLKEIIKDEMKDKNRKIMVFNQYRDNASKITEELNNIKGVNATLFVGQTKKGGTGLSQKRQKQVLDKFRNNEFNLIVATSVGEEGLDIPQVDLVIFYEPIPSAIRTIQRRGRTGRQEKGRVKILMTKGTRDEGYRWSAHHKEKRMYRTLKGIKEKLGKVLGTQTLERFIPKQETENVKIYADYREKGQGAIKELVNLGVDLKLEKLESADYILSDRVGIEFKKVEDFVNSLIDGRLLNQAKELKNNFEKPLIIIEGIEDIYSVRNIHGNAIRGMLATIVISFGIPILQTRNSKETASLLHIIAKREQDKTKKDFSMHSSRKPMSIKEQQEYIISSLPSVGPSLAKVLLKKFGSVKKVLRASKERLEKTPGVGEKIAKAIRDILDRDYQKEK